MTTDREFTLGGDRTIRRLGFGAMRLAGGNGQAVLRRAVQLGVNHIDTADFYGRANELIRAALTPYPEDLVIATKVGPLRGPDGIPSGQAPPDQLRGLVERNLDALGLDRLDLVYLRVGALSGPGGESIAERFAVLAGLREEGLIRHLGVSNVDDAQLAEARSVAPVAAVQNHVRDQELLAQCAEDGIAFVPFFPIGGGGRSPLDTGRLGKVAARHNATVPQVALAWSLAGSPVVLAIPGTGSLAHLEENMAAGRLELTAEDLGELGAQAVPDE